MTSKKKELIVLWVGVGLLILTLSFPARFGSGRIMAYRLLAQCVVVVLITGGVIYTLRAKGK